MTTVLGCVMARNEWPLLGLSIDHVLGAQVDHVVVLDHGSTDCTRDGLLTIQAQRPGKVSVIRIEDPEYLQEAATALLLQVGSARDFDWVYVFDADEFILLGVGSSLKSVLDGVPADVGLVRYQVHNWVAPASFDEFDIARYTDLTYRAVPNPMVAFGPETPDEIARGKVNFFDLPFPSKIFVRGASCEVMAAGSHEVRFPTGLRETTLAPGILRAAHLPLLSRRRLELKCRQGQALIDEGFPPRHGWQSQMLRHLEISGGLQQFWARHSVAEGEHTAESTDPNLVEDDALTEALAPTVARAGEWLLAPGWTAAPGSGEILGDVEATKAYRALCAMQRVADEAERRSATLSRGQDALQVELGLSRSAADVLKHDLDVVLVEREHLRAESGNLRAERDNLRAERDNLSAERDNLRAEWEALLGSLSWRVTRPLRSLKRRLSPGNPG